MTFRTAPHRVAPHLHTRPAVFVARGNEHVLAEVLGPDLRVEVQAALRGPRALPAAAAALAAGGVLALPALHRAVKRAADLRSDGGLVKGWSRFG